MQKNFFFRMKIWLKVIFTYLFSFNGTNAEIVSSEKTVDLILSGKSLIRFGDGEFGIYMGEGISFQAYSDELKTEFLKVKEYYEKYNGECQYILAVPKAFFEISGFELAKKRLYVSCWSQSRYFFKKHFRQDIVYGDSFLFEQKNEKIYSEIWKNSKCPENIIFIHNNVDYSRKFAEKYNKNVYFLSCPKENSYSVVDELESNICKITEDNNLSKENLMIVASAGPGGKILIFRLSLKGYFCVDAGHCWDYPLEGI